MNILVLNQYYPPDTSATAVVFRDIVGRLTSAGHDVSVLCGRPSYAPSERRRWRAVTRDHDGGAVVERVGSSAADRHDLKGRVANYVSFAVLAGARSLTRPRPDVVVVGSDPPLSVVVALVAARGRPVVYSLRDLHPEMALASGMIGPGPASRLWETVHRAALRRCRLVICLGPVMAERVLVKLPDARRVEVVEDGAWLVSDQPDPAVVGELRGTSEFVALHAGNLGGAGAWDTLAEAARRLDNGAEILFVGDGFQARALREQGVRVVPFRPKNELASVMAAGDLQIVTQRPGTEGVVVPSKIYTALAHGRPVLAVATEHSDTARIVRQHGCGLVADPDDPGDVAAKVRWAHEHPTEMVGMEERARLAAHTFDRAALLTRFTELVEKSARMIHDG